MIRPRDNRCGQIDVHELQKLAILGQYDAPAYGGGSARSATPARAPAGAPVPAASAPPPSQEIVGFEDVEIQFDSRYADTTSNYDLGEINWPVGPINNNNDISNCIQMHINSFWFPNIVVPVTSPDFFYFSRAYLEFRGAPSTQGVSCPNTGRYHFEFEVSRNDQAVKLTPIKNSFFFQRPITSITDFQIRLMVPHTTPIPSGMRRVPIPPDTVMVTSQTAGGFGTNPIQFALNSQWTTVQLLGNIGAVPAPGIAVYLSGFVSTDPAVDAAVNNTQGVYVTNIIDNTTFEVAGINALTLAAGFTASMFIPKNRFAMSVRFTCVRHGVTNYIGVTHQ